MSELACPECGADDHVAGVDVDGVYDGVLVWWCQACGHAWPRWSDGGRLSEAGAAHAAEINRVFTGKVAGRLGPAAGGQGIDS